MTTVRENKRSKLSICLSALLSFLCPLTDLIQTSVCNKALVSSCIYKSVTPQEHENIKEKRNSPSCVSAYPCHFQYYFPCTEVSGYRLCARLCSYVCFVWPNNHSSSTSASWLTSLNHSIVTRFPWGSCSTPPPTPIIFPDIPILCLRSSTKRLTQHIVLMHGVPSLECEKPLRWCLTCGDDFSRCTKNTLALYLRPGSRGKTCCKLRKLGRMFLLMCFETFRTH